ncbi:MAG: carbonic anhydrase [Miltoncostaeaceae bacterium]
MSIDRQLAYAALFGGARAPAPPATRVAIVTCMDSRIDPPVVFGLDPGDANIIRNAGGVIDDGVLRSLTISQHLLGTTGVLIVQHTGCGVLGLDDDALEARLVDHAGEAPAWRGRGFPELEASVREAVRAVRSYPFLLHTDNVRGAILDLESGGAVEVTVED